MKNFKTNIEEVMELVNQFSQFDDLSMKIIICALIDKVSANSGESVIAILDAIFDAVLAVNEVLGPLQPDKKGELQ